MLISDQNKSKKNLGAILKYVLGFILLIAIVIISYPYFLTLGALNDSEIIYCDAEIVKNGRFISNGEYFLNGNTQSDEKARSGKYSSKHSESEKTVFGMTYYLTAKPGDVFKVSVWKKKGKGDSSGALVFSSKDGVSFYETEDEVSETDKDGWSLLKLFVHVPDDYIKKTITVYTISNGKGEVFFDDLIIEKLKEIPKSIVEKEFQPRHINIEIGPKNYRKLELKRKEALDSRLIITKEDSWVKASIHEIGTEDKFPVKIRLKGDWLDHLYADKWSFRIKVKDPFAWNRLKTFSVHNPKARYYVLEWLLHEFWIKEGVLTTRYDFITLSVNGKSRGIYAYEEHFAKELLEYQFRREGPIIRFSENALWDARQRHFKLRNGQIHNRRDFPKFPIADIQPFQKNKIAQSVLLSEQYIIAQNLLFQYQQGTQSASEIFDLDLMAKYTAIADILGAYHGLFWHNQRYYYNPVTSLLEPIGYDGIGGRPRRDPLILGKSLIENEMHVDNGPLRKLYNDPDFIKSYMYFLDQFTQKKYLENFFSEIDKELMARVAFLKTEFPNFNYNKNRILKRVNQIRFRMFPYNEHSINANWYTNNKSERVIQLSNTHELPLRIVGSGIYSNWLRDTLEKELALPGHRIGYKRIIQELKVPSDAKFVFYKPYGIDSLFTSSISNFPQPNGYVPAQKIFAQKEIKSNKYYEVVGKEVFFRKGKYTWSKDIIIPKGYRVVFEAGVNADLVNNSKFISKSPVFLNGTNEEPIIIYSSDKTGNGFSILQAPTTSELYYVIFKDLNTLNYEGWKLTGAVTFYESDVIIKNCLFKDIHCEDALNTIRCNFNLENSMIVNTFSDGFDADFCTGLVLGTDFVNIGNDCVDFSGSRIEIKNSNMTNCGDKGVSAGEESYVVIDDVIVDGAVIGVASKDLSYLSIEKIVLKNCNQGFVAYQKKAEYGVSSIFVRAFTEENVKYLRTIAPRCTIEYKGRVYVGGE